MLDGNSGGLELHRVLSANTNTQSEPPSRGDVEGVGELGQDRGVVEGQEQNRWDQADSGRGPCGYRKRH